MSEACIVLLAADERHVHERPEDERWQTLSEG